MSPVQIGEIIPIISINGSSPSVTGFYFLKIGWTLRGTCRSLERVVNLMNGGWKPYASGIEIAIIPDILIPSASDEAVKGKKSSYTFKHPRFLLRQS